VLATNNGIQKLAFGKITLKNIDTSLPHSWLIGEVRGIWTGTILEREIENENFSFLSQHKLIVKKGSKISKHLTELYQQGKTQKICSLIRLLEDAYTGTVDLAVKEFL